jgi:hypothetical protein
MLRLAGIVLLCVAASGCTEVIAATSGSACGPKMDAVKRTYAALEKSDVVGSAMGMARTMRNMDQVDNDDYDSPRARRRMREMERAGRSHSRNMAALQRATTAYTDASKVCWFVPPPPVGAARAISFH